MGFGITVKIDDAAFQQQLDRLVQKIGSGQEPNLKRGLKQSAARYLDFVRRRYSRAARGDGTWKDLAESTKLGRLSKNQKVLKRYEKAYDTALEKHKGDKRKAQSESLAGHRFEILKNTGILFNSLTTGSPGSVTIEEPGSIQVGTAVRYGIYHQKGGTKPGHPPKREIIVEPDANTLKAITSTLEAALLKAITANFGNT